MRCRGRGKQAVLRGVMKRRCEEGRAQWPCLETWSPRAIPVPKSRRRSYASPTQTSSLVSDFAWLLCSEEGKRVAGGGEEGARTKETGASKEGKGRGKRNDQWRRPREDGRHPPTELTSDFAVVVFGPFNAEGGRSWFFLDTEIFFCLLTRHRFSPPPALKGPKTTTAKSEVSSVWGG